MLNVRKIVREPRVENWRQESAFMRKLLLVWSIFVLTSFVQSQTITIYSVGAGGYTLGRDASGVIYVLTNDAWSSSLRLGHVTQFSVGDSTHQAGIGPEFSGTSDCGGTADKYTRTGGSSQWTENDTTPLCATIAKAGASDGSIWLKDTATPENIYLSTNFGTSFSFISGRPGGSGNPAVSLMSAGNASKLWLLEGSLPSSKIFKYAGGGAWTQITGTADGLVVNAAGVVYKTLSGAVSKWNGSSWTSQGATGGTPPAFENPGDGTWSFVGSGGAGVYPSADLPQILGANSGHIRFCGNVGIWCPFNGAVIQKQANGNASHMQKTFPASDFPSTGQYNLEIELTGSSANGQYPEIDVPVDGSFANIVAVHTGNQYGPSITYTLDATDLNSQYITTQAFLSGGVSHTVGIQMLGGPLSDGALYVKQVIVYPSSQTLSGTCTLLTGPGTVNIPITGTTVIGLATNCSSLASGVTSLWKVTWNADPYTCGSTACKVLDIQD